MVQASTAHEHGTAWLAHGAVNRAHDVSVSKVESSGGQPVQRRRADVLVPVRADCVGALSSAKRKRIFGRSGVDSGPQAEMVVARNRISARVRAEVMRGDECNSVGLMDSKYIERGLPTITEQRLSNYKA